MTRELGLVKRAGLIAIAAIVVSILEPAHADPFSIRDQNPLLGGFGLPSTLPARIATSEWTLATQLDWASTALVQSNAREALTVDAESQELRVTLQRSLAERFALRLELPYRRLSAGSLDAFIDDWHDAFGLPEGARPRMPRDRLAIAYERDGVRLLTIDSAHSGFADVNASLGYQLRADDEMSASAWLSIDLPLGDARHLTGNEQLDVSMTLAAARRLGQRWSVFGQASATRLGEGELLPRQQRDLVWSAMAGLSWRAIGPVEVKLQIDAHSGVFGGSELDFLGDAVALTVGGSIHLESGWRLDLAVSEDIAVETTPDVVFVIGLRSGTRAF